MSFIFLLRTLSLKFWQMLTCSVSSQILSARMKYFFSIDVDKSRQQTSSFSQRQVQGGYTVKQKYLEQTKYRMLIRQSQKNQEEKRIWLLCSIFQNRGRFYYSRQDSSWLQFTKDFIYLFFNVFCNFLRKDEEKQMSLALGVEMGSSQEEVANRKVDQNILEYSYSLLHFSSFLSKQCDFSHNCDPFIGVLISPIQLLCDPKRATKPQSKSCLCLRKMILSVGSLQKMYLMKVLTKETEISANFSLNQR